MQLNAKSGMLENFKEVRIHRLGADDRSKILWFSHVDHETQMPCRPCRVTASLLYRFMVLEISTAQAASLRVRYVKQTYILLLPRRQHTQTMYMVFVSTASRDSAHESFKSYRCSRSIISHVVRKFDTHLVDQWWCRHRFVWSARPGNIACEGTAAAWQEHNRMTGRSSDKRGISTTLASM